MATVPAILGLDIGGANLKAAHTSGVAKSVAFPLWKHPERLRDELARLAAAMPPFERLAITMTGELCDCFATKREGVHAILAGVRRAWPNAAPRIWSNGGSFVDFDEALRAPLQIAAANWLALAHHVGQLFPHECVLLIDSGSTTTDITYIDHGQPEPNGLSDPERLASGSLMYTGVRRTPIASVLGFVVAAELFATMQDAYVWRRLIPEDASDCDTADRRPLTRDHAHARLARMHCADRETFTEADADRLADAALETQWDAVTEAIRRVLMDRAGIERILVAGSGEILAQSVCERQPDWNRVPRVSLAQMLGQNLSVAACAYAVAYLATREADA